MDREALEMRIAAFDALDLRHDAAARKAAVREVEAEVRAGMLRLAKTEAEAFLARDAALARILVHLLAENARLPAGVADARHAVEGEWDRLRRGGLDPRLSRMPLHYALRAYLSALRRDPVARMAGHDLGFFHELKAALDASPSDMQSSARGRVVEVLRLLEAGTGAAPPAERGPLLAARATIVGAIIAAIAAIAVGVLSNWNTLTAMPHAGVVVPSPDGDTPSSPG